jgi:hypothetical protein
VRQLQEESPGIVSELVKLGQKFAGLKGIDNSNCPHKWMFAIAEKHFDWLASAAMDSVSHYAF